MFKKIDAANMVVDYRIRNYTLDDIERYIANPIQYQSQLTDLSNFIYTAHSGFYREIIDFYVKTILYRWHVDVKALDISLEKVQPEKLRADFIAYSARITHLNLGRELHRILLQMFLEDVVYGYWLEDGETATLYYLPVGWCLIRKKLNGNWAYEINTSKISQRDIEKLPKELQSLINKYKGKSGEEAYAPVPMEKSLCVKFLDHLNYVLPPFVYIISLVVELGKAKAIEFAKSEQDVINLISMLIPVSEQDDDHLRFTDPLIKQFATGITDILPDGHAVLPTPMKLEVLETNKNQTTERNIVKNSIDAFQEETFVSSLGASNNSAEMKRSIQNASAKVFALLDQIAQAINLKMKLDGFANYGSYDFEYKILHINLFNEEDVVGQLLTSAQNGLMNKFELMAAQGKDPSVVIGQSMIENVAFRDMFDNMTVLKTSHTQSGGGGREPYKKESDLTDSGLIARENEVNDPEKRDN